MLTIALGLMISPVLYESGLICAARWKAMTGTIPTVRTPVLDALGTRLPVAARMVCEFVTSLFRRLPWNPYWVMGYAFVLAFVASCFLRR